MQRGDLPQVIEHLDEHAASYVVLGLGGIPDRQEAHSSVMARQIALQYVFRVHVQR